MVRRQTSSLRSASLRGVVALLALMLGMLNCEGEQRPYTAPMEDTLAVTPAAGSPPAGSLEAHREARWQCSTTCS